MRNIMALMNKLLEDLLEMEEMNHRPNNHEDSDQSSYHEANSTRRLSHWINCVNLYGDTKIDNYHHVKMST